MSDPPSERDSPFDSPDMDSVRGRGDPMPEPTAPPPAGGPRRRRTYAVLAVVVLVTAGAVAAAAVGLGDDGGGDPGPPVTSLPTATEGSEQPR